MKGLSVREIDLADLLEGGGDLSVDDRGRTDPDLVVLHLDDADWNLAPSVVARLSEGAHPLVVGHCRDELPPSSGPLLEALAVTLAPAGPGRSWVAGDLASLTTAVAAAPGAAFVLGGVMRASPFRTVVDGLAAESAAYSMLLAGPEFRAWRESVPARPVPWAVDPVLLERHGDVLQVLLNRPERRNAFGRQVRDGFLEALELGRLDPTLTSIRLGGVGPCFCSGGDLDEFGEASDAVAAHALRLARSAGLAVHRLRDRVVPELQGACIGAGIEVPAFARRVLAHADAWFALPELAMGLMPGAGGTVSLTSRIGRWRTAWMALTGARVDVDTALAWGLVDERA